MTGKPVKEINKALGRVRVWRERQRKDRESLKNNFRSKKPRYCWEG
ncbi:MAG: hypothetical protein L6406_08560 [Desulfobacterales bacterium]|nr:hypothetical protein [Desulfobacterales bacterium]